MRYTLSVRTLDALRTLRGMEPATPTLLRMLAGYHASTNLVVHVQHAEEVIRRQRAALIRAADRIEELEARAASDAGAGATVQGQE